MTFSSQFSQLLIFSFDSKLVVLNLLVFGFDHLLILPGDNLELLARFGNITLLRFGRILIRRAKALLAHISISFVRYSGNHIQTNMRFGRVLSFGSRMRSSLPVLGYNPIGSLLLLFVF